MSTEHEIHMGMSIWADTGKIDVRPVPNGRALIFIGDIWLSVNAASANALSLAARRAGAIIQAQQAQEEEPPALEPDELDCAVSSAADEF